MELLWVSYGSILKRRPWKPHDTQNVSMGVPQDFHETFAARDFHRVYGILLTHESLMEVSRKSDMEVVAVYGTLTSHRSIIALKGQSMSRA